jgi:hypothetical protein
VTRDVFTATIAAASPGGGVGGTAFVGRAQEPVASIAALAAAIAAAIALAPATATVAANIATLVADGASPTQAHVTTLNTNWGIFLTAETTYRAAVAALSTTASSGSLTADVTLLFNVATVTDKNTLRTAVLAILAQATNKSALLAGD